METTEKKGRGRPGNVGDSKIPGGNSVVFVSNVSPPRLDTCMSFLEMHRFVMEYSDYNSLGGDIPVVRCVSSVIRGRLTTEEKAQDNPEIIKALLKTYAPTEHTEVIIELNKLRFRGWRGHLIDVDKMTIFIWKLPV